MAGLLFLPKFSKQREQNDTTMDVREDFERLKVTIMRNDFLRTIIIVGLMALACLIIYIVGKCTGKFFATI